MSRAKKHHLKGFKEELQKYADSRALDLHQYSPYHFRLSDGGYTTLDTWTTGRYYVLMTDYAGLEIDMVERGGEKGFLPMALIENFLDVLFFGEGV